MADKINVLIPEETVDAKIKEIGEQISKDYAGKEVHLICILKGGYFLHANWQRESLYQFLLTLCRYLVMVMQQKVQESYVLRRTLMIRWRIKK